MGTSDSEMVVVPLTVLKGTLTVMADLLQKYDAYAGDGHDKDLSNESNIHLKAIEKIIQGHQDALRTLASAEDIAKIERAPEWLHPQGGSSGKLRDDI